MNYDVIYYYSGGTMRGTWHAAEIGPDGVEATVERIERMGYFCRLGRRSIGAPEGAPSEMFADSRDHAALRALSERISAKVNSVHGVVTRAEADEQERLERLTGMQWDAACSRWTPRDGD